MTGSRKAGAVGLDIVCDMLEKRRNLYSFKELEREGAKISFDQIVFHQ